MKNTKHDYTLKVRSTALLMYRLLIYRSSTQRTSNSLPCSTAMRKYDHCNLTQRSCSGLWTQLDSYCDNQDHFIIRKSIFEGRKARAVPTACMPLVQQQRVFTSIRLFCLFVWVYKKLFITSSTPSSYVVTNIERGFVYIRKSHLLKLVSPGLRCVISVLIPLKEWWQNARHPETS